MFVEVKTRRSEQAGHPVEAITPSKQAQLTRLTLTFLKQRQLLARPARFDVVAVLWSEHNRHPELSHYRDAFRPPGHGQLFS